MATAQAGWRAHELLAAAALSLSPAQLQRYVKVHQEAFFLLDVRPTPSALDYTISGSTHVEYRIRLYADGSLSCTCPDARTNCRRQGCVCKHVCFVLLRVMRYHGLEFFDRGHRLPPAVWERISAARGVGVPGVADAVDATALAPALAHTLGLAVRAPHGLFGAPTAAALERDPDCPICYDVLLGGGGAPAAAAAAVGCPACGKGVHALCMRRWLARSAHATCVWCRSPVWETWGIEQRETMP